MIVISIGSIRLGRTDDGKVYVESFPPENFFQRLMFLLVIAILCIWHKILPKDRIIDHGDIGKSLLENNVGISFPFDRLKEVITKWEHFVATTTTCPLDSDEDLVHQAWWLDSTSAILQSFWMRGWFISRTVKDGTVSTECQYYLPKISHDKVVFAPRTGRLAAIQYSCWVCILFLGRTLERLLPLKFQKRILARRLSRIDLTCFVGDDLLSSAQQLKLSWFISAIEQNSGLYVPKEPDAVFHAMWTEVPLGTIIAGFWAVGFFVPHYAPVALEDEDGLPLRTTDPLTKEEMGGIYNDNLRHISLILGCEPEQVSIS